MAFGADLCGLSSPARPLPSLAPTLRPHFGGTYGDVHVLPVVQSPWGPLLLGSLLSLTAPALSLSAFPKFPFPLESIPHHSELWLLLMLLFCCFFSHLDSNLVGKRPVSVNSQLQFWPQNGPQTLSLVTARKQVRWEPLLGWTWGGAMPWTHTGSGSPLSGSGTYGNLCNLSASVSSSIKWEQ